MVYVFNFVDESTGAVFKLDEVKCLTTFNGAAEVLDENGSVIASMQLSGPFDGECLIDLAASIVHDGIDAETTYTAGGCDQLAVALSRAVSGGHIVAVVDPNDETGEPLQSPDPYMIHAGLLVGDMVLDVRGLSPVESWVEEWSSLGSTDCYLDYPSEGRMTAALSGREAFMPDADALAGLLALACGMCPLPLRRSPEGVPCMRSR